jgi:hypothetical protein
MKTLAAILALAVMAGSAHAQSVTPEDALKLPCMTMLQIQEAMSGRPQSCEKPVVEYIHVCKGEMINGALVLGDQTAAQGVVCPAGPSVKSTAISLWHFAARRRLQIVLLFGLFISLLVYRRMTRSAFKCDLYSKEEKP